MNSKVCTICAKSFSDNIRLDLHIQKVHGNRKPKEKFECDECDFKAVDETGLTNHVKVQHGSCNPCKIKFDDVREVELHMKKFHESETTEEIKTFETINIEFGQDDDEESLPPQYTTKSYPKDPEDPTQVTHKSIQKSLLFGKALGNLGKILKRDAKITIGKTKAIVKDSRGKTSTCLEAEVELNLKKESGCARIKIWGPKEEGKKKDCTVQISKMEGHPAVLVKTLNDKIVKPLLDHLLVNSDSKNAIKSLSNATTSKDESTDEDEESLPPIPALKPKCDPCKKEFSNIRTMRKHKRDEHPVHGKSQVATKQVIMSGNKRKKEPKLKKTVESPPRKLRVVEDSSEEKKAINMEIDEISQEDRIITLQKTFENKIAILQAEVDSMKFDKIQNKTENEQLKKVIKNLTTEEENNTETIPNDLKDKIKAVKQEHLPLLKGFKLAHKGIPSGACLTFCAGVQFHDDENQGPNVKLEVNNQISEKFEEFYINEIGLPYTETVGVGEARVEITLKTVDEAKEFFKDPKSGSLDIYSNQAEMKAIANIYNTNIHVFTFGQPNCEPKWTSVGPDPSLFSEAQFPKNTTTDMYLYHEYDNHFDLLVDAKKIQRLTEVQLNEINKEPTEKTTKSEAWTKVKKSKDTNKPLKNKTNVVEEEEFLSSSQKMGEILYRNKLKGYRREGPTAEAVREISDQNTLCHICKLRCTTNNKLRTHMKSHTRDETYDMSSLQNAIHTSKNTSKDTSKDTSLTISDHIQVLRNRCNKCKENFMEKHELRKHISAEHPTFKPCRNYKGPSDENSCSFGSKCDYNHIVVEEGTHICWECGQLFTRRGELMSHRKHTHGVSVICRKLREPGGCDRTNEECWYSHAKQKQQPIETTEQDFPKLSQNKETPIEIDEVREPPKPNYTIQTPKVQQKQPQKEFQTLRQTTSETPKQEQNTMLEIMKMIHQQNIMLMNMMTKMNQHKFQ